MRVKDNGAGISKEAQAKIFTPFYTTKKTGMGMGLSICQSLINSHNGEIRFNCNKDKGTTFYFTLPINEVGKKMDREDITIFIVEDELPIRDSLTQLIESTGLKVKSYDSAIAFLEQYDSTKPGCLILDVLMPYKSGLELQDELVQRNIDIAYSFFS